MAIVLQPSGLAAAYGSAAQMAGEAATAHEARQQQHEERMQQIKEAADVEATARSHAWEMEKMEYESRQQFAREHLQEDAQLKRDTLISDLDAQRDAKKHAEMYADLDASDKAIDDYAKKNGLTDDPEMAKTIEGLKLQERLRALGKNPQAADILFPEMFDKTKRTQAAKEAERDRRTKAVIDSNLPFDEKQRELQKIETGIAPAIQHPAFTAAKVQEFAGMVQSGFVPDPTMPTMRMPIKSRQQAENAAATAFGPNWRVNAPEVANSIDIRFGGHPVVDKTTAIKEMQNIAPTSAEDFVARTKQIGSFDDNAGRDYWNMYHKKFESNP